VSDQIITGRAGLAATGLVVLVQLAGRRPLLGYRADDNSGCGRSNAI
jgi:hypothetical protein